MTTWECFDLDNDPELECGEFVEAYDAEDAAKEYTEQHWSDHDHSRYSTVLVKDCGEVVGVFEVEAVPDVTFSASEIA